MKMPMFAMCFHGHGTRSIFDVSTVCIAVFALFYLDPPATKPNRAASASVGTPKAADTLGVPVYLMKYIGVLSSGFLAGLGGAALSMAIISSFRPTLVSGQGFIALAAMIFGRWTPHGAILGCLLFGLAQGLVVFLGGGRLPISEQLLRRCLM